MLALLGLAAAGAASPEPMDSRMANLYEEVCLTAFPNDDAIRERVAAYHARELSAEEVSVTMGTDPAVGWFLPSEHATVWIEFPPYHACSVRWNAPEIGTLETYRKVAEKFKAAKGAFNPLERMEGDRGDIHISIISERMVLPDLKSETLMVVEQHISNPARRAAGETGVSVRFVHQFAPAAKMQ